MSQSTTSLSMKFLLITYEAVWWLNFDEKHWFWSLLWPIKISQRAFVRKDYNSLLFFCSLNNLNQVWLVNFPSRSKPWLGCAVKFRPKIDLWFHLIDSFWERGYSGLLLFVGENARGYFARGYFLPLWWTYSSYLTVLREFLATSAK